MSGKARSPAASLKNVIYVYRSRSVEAKHKFVFFVVIEILNSWNNNCDLQTKET